MPEEAAVRIEGLAEFSRRLKKMDADLPKALRIALNQAAQVVVDDAKPLVPQRTGKAAASIKVRSTRTAVRVSEGGTSAPYMPWLDFGGRVGRKKSVQRPFLKDGRYIYPSYYKLKKSGEFESVLAKALIGVAEQAGIEVT